MRLKHLVRRTIIGVVVLGLLAGTSALLPPIGAAESPQSETAVVKMVGADAKKFVKEVVSKRGSYAEAQQESAEVLTARGFTPTDEVSVVVLKRRRAAPRAASLMEQVIRTAIPSLRAQQETFYSDEGYGVMWSWDDGNGGTWEGNSYFVDYGDNIDTSIDNQLDVTRDYEPPVLWASGGIYRDGGLRSRIAPDEAAAMLKGHDFGIVPVVNTTTPLMAPPTAAAMQYSCSCTAPVVSRCFLREGWGESWGRCAGFAIFCRGAGAFYWGCLGAGCGGTFTGSVINSARSWYRRCVQ